LSFSVLFFFFQAEDGIRDFHVTGVQTCALPILKTLMNQKNFKKEVIKKFNARGKLVYGKDFRIAYHRIPLLVEFVNYAMSTKDIAYSTPIIPNKGILLLGHQDSGKTAWMHLVKPFFDEGERYALRRIQEINMKFILY